MISPIQWYCRQEDAVQVMIGIPMTITLLILGGGSAVVFVLWLVSLIGVCS